MKEQAADQELTFESLTGKNVFVSVPCTSRSVPSKVTSPGSKVFVPGAFTGTCTRQVPGYAEAYSQFKEKGVENVYIVAVNDVFVMQ